MQPSSPYWGRTLTLALALTLALTLTRYWGVTQLLLGPGASLALAPAADLEAADLSSADLAPAVGRAAEGRVPPAPKQPRAGAREGTEEQRCSHVTAEQPDQACDPVTPISSGALNRTSRTRCSTCYAAALTVLLLTMKLHLLWAGGLRPVHVGVAASRTHLARAGQVSATPG